MKISLKKLKKIIPLLGITAMVLCVNTGSNFHIGVNHLNRSLENSNTNPNDSQQFVIDYPIPSYADYPALGSWGLVDNYSARQWDPSAVPVGTVPSDAYNSLTFSFDIANEDALHRVSKDWQPWSYWYWEQGSTPILENLKMNINYNYDYQIQPTDDTMQPVDMTRTFNIPVDVPPSVGYYNDITDYTHTDFWYSTPKYNVNEPNWDNVAMPEDNNIIWQLRYCGKNPTEYDHGYSLSDFVYIKFDGHVAGGAFVFELKLDFTNLDIPHMGPKTVELVGEQLQEIWHTEDTQQYHDHPAMTMWTDTGHDYADQAPGFFRFEIYHQQN